MRIAGVTVMLKVTMADVLTYYSDICCLARAHQNHHEAD